MSVISSLVTNFQSQALSDCYRLGKFNPLHSKPRPILVKFIRVADVSLVLSKKGSLKAPTCTIKPDMTREQRLKEPILLKERWTLIQSGIPRNSFRLCNSNLLVNKLHGQVVGSAYKCAVDLNPLSSDSNQSTNVLDPIVEPSCSQIDSQSPTNPAVFHCLLVFF